MTNHHKVFEKFQCWQGEVDAGFTSDFLGILTDNRFFSMLDQASSKESKLVQTDYPPFNEQYFEWIALLKAVAEAKDSFTMIELGAGWGCWLCRGAAALKQLNVEARYFLVGVEADPTHFHWITEHLLRNRIELENCELIEAAVGKRNGTADFLVLDPFQSYGQRIAKMWWDRSRKTRKVNTISLRTLLNKLNIVDLIDLDIQGAEYIVLSNTAKELDKKVKRVFIGTHSEMIEDNLRKLFKKLGWHNEYDFYSRKEMSTEFGEIKFQDGVQSWINPKLIQGF